MPSRDMVRMADDRGAIPYDIPVAEFSHVGELCSFDAILKKYELDDHASQQRTAIVRVPIHGGWISRHNLPECMHCHYGCLELSVTAMKCTSKGW